MKKERVGFLRDLGYSGKAIDLIDREVNVGSISRPTVWAQHQGSCGDIIEIFLVVDSGVIIDAKFQFSGCAGLQASASGLTEMIKGMRIEDALIIDAEDILKYLEGIPKVKYDCVELTRNCLRKAIQELNVQKS